VAPPLQAVATHTTAALALDPAHLSAQARALRWEQLLVAVAEQLSVHLQAVVQAQQSARQQRQADVHGTVTEPATDSVTTISKDF